MNKEHMRIAFTFASKKFSSIDIKGHFVDWNSLSNIVVSSKGTSRTQIFSIHRLILNKHLHIEDS